MSRSSTVPSSGREIERVYADKGCAAGSKARRPRRTQAAQGFHLRPAARCPRPDQTRTGPPISHRGRDRPHEDRRPSGPQLPQGPPRRPGQCRAHCRPLQPVPHPQLAQGSLAQILGKHPGGTQSTAAWKSGLLTVNIVTSLVVRFMRSTWPLVQGWFGLVKRCSMPCSRHRRSDMWVAHRAVACRDGAAGR